MKSAYDAMGAAVAAILALGLPQAARAAGPPPPPRPSAFADAPPFAGSPIGAGRWVALEGSAGGAEAIQKACAKPATYIQVTAAEIREVSPGGEVRCEMPTWTQSGPMRFGGMKRCTPPASPGENVFRVDLEADGTLTYQGTRMTRCPDTVAASQPAAPSPSPVRGDGAPIAPIAHGRWVLANGEKQPAPAELAALCGQATIYLDVTASQIREVAPPHTSVCATPKWRRTPDGQFEGTMTKCTPAVAAGEETVRVEIKGAGIMLYNNAPFALCQGAGGRGSR